MIPRLIHQTAKTAEIPEKWKALQSRLRELNPGWEYRLWTDADNDAFVAEHYPEFLEIFRDLRKPIMRADVIRYLLMHKLGGVYLDLDYEMLVPFDFERESIVLPLEYNEPVQIGNCIFASEAGHPFWQMVIDELMRDPPIKSRPQEAVSAKDANRWGDPGEAVERTGPRFISKVYRKALAEGMTFCSPPPEVYNAPPPTSPRKHRAILDAGIAKGIHWCHGSWREYAWYWRVRDRLASFVKRWM